MPPPRRFRLIIGLVVALFVGGGLGVTVFALAGARSASSTSSTSRPGSPVGTAAGTTIGTRAPNAPAPPALPAPPTTAIPGSARPTGGRAADEAVEPDEDVEDVGDADGAVMRYPLSPAELADWNRDADGLAAFLAQAGIGFARWVDPSGLVEIEWDEDDDAANRAVDDYYWQQHPLTAIEINDLNNETASLDAVLTEAGVAHVLTTDPHGVVEIEYDEDDDAANAIVDRFYDERG